MGQVTFDTRDAPVDHIQVQHSIITRRPPVVEYPREFQEQILRYILTNQVRLVDLPIVDGIMFEDPSIPQIRCDPEYPDSSPQEIDDAVDTIYSRYTTIFHLVRIGGIMVTITVECDDDDNLKFRFY